MYEGLGTLESIGRERVSLLLLRLVTLVGKRARRRAVGIRRCGLRRRGAGDGEGRRREKQDPRHDAAHEILLLWKN